MCSMFIRESSGDQKQREKEQLEKGAAKRQSQQRLLLTAQGAVELERPYGVIPSQGGKPGLHISHVDWSLDVGCSRWGLALGSVAVSVMHFPEG